MAFHNVPPNGFPDLPDVEELEAVIKDVTNLKTSVSGLSEDVSDLNDTKANQITIAPFFNEETAYEVGDLVYYNGLSYRCTTAHEGEWDADDFAATTIANELANLNISLPNYSTTEQLTGQKWIDGKDIYFKVLHFDTRKVLSAGENRDIVEIENIDFVQAWAVDYGQKFVQDQLQIGIDLGKLYIFNAANKTIGVTDIVMYYTKTA